MARSPGYRGRAVARWRPARNQAAETLPKWLLALPFLEMVDRGLELMLIGLWRCAQRHHPSHDAELELPRDGRTPRK
uniref:Uncharacterized protein n=1 Tax=Oryza nivara TaxID=4536 RepID=A0A0E0FMA7_ORYNI